MGSGSMQLARIMGIRIGANASWFLVLFLFVFLLGDSFTASLGGNRTGGYLTAGVASLLFFASIVAHELGHALAARRDGIGVAGIDLFFFGGLMRMTRDTDSPGSEFRVAVAGPLVTVALVLAGATAGVLMTGSFAAFLSVATLEAGTRASVPELLLAFLVSMNVLLLVLNLVPAFPLDGGRIARAAAWKLTGSRVRATRISSALGQAFALLLVGYGVLLVVLGAVVNGLWLVVLGWLLGQAARGAVAQATFSDRLSGVAVSDVMDDEPVVIPAGTPVLRAWDDFFLRYHGWKWFPVADADGRPLGIAHRAAMETAARDETAESVVDAVMAPVAPEGLVTCAQSLEQLVASPELRRRGSLLAVDADGRLRGIVTPRHVSRALSARLGPR